MDNREYVKRICEVIAPKIYAVENPNAEIPAFEDLQQIIDRLEKTAQPFNTGVIFNETLLKGGRFEGHENENPLVLPIFPIMILGRYNVFEEKDNFVFVKDGDWFVEGVFGLEGLNEVVNRLVAHGSAFIYGYYLLNGNVYETAYPEYRVGADGLFICDYSSEFLIRDEYSEDKQYLMTLKGVAEVCSEWQRYIIYCPSVSDIYDFVLENCLPTEIGDLKAVDGLITQGSIIWGFCEKGLKLYDYEIENKHGKLQAYIHSRK